MMRFPYAVKAVFLFSYISTNLAQNLTLLPQSHISISQLSSIVSLASPFNPARRPPLRLVPSTTIKPVRMRAGMVVYALITCVTTSWLKEQPTPLPESSRVKESWFEQNVTFHLDGPRPDFTTQTAGWACLRMLDRLLVGNGKSEGGTGPSTKDWVVPMYDIVFGDDGTDPIGYMLLESKHLPPQLGEDTNGTTSELSAGTSLLDANETASRSQAGFSGAKIPASKRRQARAVETFELEGSLLEHEEMDITYSQRYTGQRMYVRRVSDLVTDVLRQVPWLRHPTAPVSDEFHEGETLESDPSESRDRIEVTALKLESEGTEILWKHWASCLRAAILEPIIKNKWDSFTADFSFKEHKEPFIRVKTFVARAETEAIMAQAL